MARRAALVQIGLVNEGSDEEDDGVSAVGEADADVEEIMPSPRALYLEGGSTCRLQCLGKQLVSQGCALQGRETKQSHPGNNKVSRQQIEKALRASITFTCDQHRSAPLLHTSPRTPTPITTTTSRLVATKPFHTTLPHHRSNPVCLCSCACSKKARKGRREVKECCGEVGE